MHLHEYQAKELFAEYGVPVPRGRAVRSLRDLHQAVAALGGERWVVKAQVHAGGRGKGGGVRLAEDVEGLEAAVDALLGSRLVTPQTSPDGLPVDVVLVEEASATARELYLGLLVDRERERVVLMASAAGGMDIEELAARGPEKILTTAVHPAAGLQPFQCRRLGFALGLAADQVKAFTSLVQGIYRLFLDSDASLVEINPLIVTEHDDLCALDAKVNLDDNALFRQRALAELRDASQEDVKEHAAAQHGLNYVSLDGNIACMVNGAGLAMATMDLIKLHGGEPANFLDVGGGTTAEKVAEAFKLILSDRNVRAILVNIFGGIVRCDLIAEGIVSAAREVGIDVPVVARLEGTNVERGRAILDSSGLKITAARDLTEAAQLAVGAAWTTNSR